MRTRRLGQSSPCTSQGPEPSSRPRQLLRPELLGPDPLRPPGPPDARLEPDPSTSTEATRPPGAPSTRHGRLEYLGVGSRHGEHGILKYTNAQTIWSSGPAHSAAGRDAARHICQGHDSGDGLCSGCPAASARLGRTNPLPILIRRAWPGTASTAERILCTTSLRGRDSHAPQGFLARALERVAGGPGGSGFRLFTGDLVLRQSTISRTILGASLSALPFRSAESPVLGTVDRGVRMIATVTVDAVIAAVHAAGRPLTSGGSSKGGDYRCARLVRVCESGPRSQPSCAGRRTVADERAARAVASRLRSARYPRYGVDGAAQQPAGHGGIDVRPDVALRRGCPYQVRDDLVHLAPLHNIPRELPWTRSSRVTR